MKYIFKNKTLKILIILAAVFSYNNYTFSKSCAHQPAKQNQSLRQSSKEEQTFQQKLLLLKNPFLADLPKAKAHIIQSSQAVPVNTMPILKGIIQSNEQQAAIIEYSGTSNFYVSGQTFGPYHITNITADSVTYSDCNTTYTLKIEGK